MVVLLTLILPYFIYRIFVRAHRRSPTPQPTPVGDEVCLTRPVYVLSRCSGAAPTAG
ncbi:MAG: hypothetical protein OHK0046_51220 [Anaerolineae bacterium]